MTRAEERKDVVDRLEALCAAEGYLCAVAFFISDDGMMLGALYARDLLRADLAEELRAMADSVESGHLE